MSSSHHEPSLPHKRSRRSSSSSGGGKSGGSRRRNGANPCGGNEQNDMKGRLGGGGGSSNSSRLLTTVALMASGAAMVLLSSSSTGTTVGDGYSYSYGNLRFSRRLDANAGADANARRASVSTAESAVTTTGGGSISQTVAQLTEPFLADEANIFAFDAADPRPVIHTFFAIPETLTIRKDDAETLAVWKQAWSALGWNPVSKFMLFAC